jgi:hypothetical protein
VAPLDGATFASGAEVNVSVDANDPDGIEEINLLVDGSLYDSDSTLPYNFIVPGLSDGTHTLQAKIKDNLGNFKPSAIITITVGTASTPTPTPTPTPSGTFCHIDSPLDGATFAAGEDIIVNANGQDPDGIEKMNLLVDNSYYTSDSTAPYSFIVSGLSSGSHTLKAKIKDLNGKYKASSNVNITVL